MAESDSAVGCNGCKLQQAQHAIATMMKRMLHEDGTEHEDNSTASSGRSWEGDIDASWTMKEKAVGFLPESTCSRAARM